MQAEYKTSIATLHATFANGMSEMRAEMAKNEAEGAKRETNTVRTMVAVVIGVVGLTTAFLGILIKVLFNSPAAG